MAVNNKALARKFLRNTKQIADFSKVLSFGSYFSPELARSAITQQVERQFQPQIDTAISGVKQSFINRGLARSGYRGQAEQQTFADLADQAAQTGEQLYGIREQQARENYGDLQRQYEKAPTSYKGPKGTTTPKYMVEGPQQYQMTKDVYGGAGLQQGGESNYLQAYRDYLKRKSPSYYSQYYGA